MKRRILSIITALALCLSLCPTWALAAEADPALCKHHPEHTEDCGYTAPAEGQPCGHEHTAECYALEVLPDTESGDDYEIGADTENLLDCQHTHDSECGYVQANPGQSCGYECRICPIEDLIAALPDTVMEDNADNVRAQLDHILALYGELSWEEQEQIDLSRVYELQGALDGANDPAPITESVEYQEASWDGSQVTYESKTETCTLVENSAEAVTWTAGWYAVSGTVTIDQPITVTGAVNLILTDGCDLTAAKGIVVTDGNSLTIYAQSKNGGTLNATGTTDDSGNASAGIGGSTSSFDSGSITIYGGIINATGGVANNNFGNPNYGGAGIGGSTTSSGNGGNSGTIEIYGGTITANSGEGSSTGAGIGGGGGGNGKNGGDGSGITIYGGNVTAASHGTQSGGAGIGGGEGDIGNGGAGNNIQINGGMVHATGGYLGAGIGGGGGVGKKSGDGTVTISGGTVTAVGGSYAAGIGGGGGYQYSNQWVSDSTTGGTGSVTITGGIVDASSPTDVDWEGYEGAPIGNGGNASGTATVNKTTGIVFENGVGTVCGDVTFDGSYPVPADYTLNIPAGASLSGSGTLTGGGTFTADLSEDMVSVPTDLYYNGQDRSNDIKTRLSDGLTQGIAICGQTFAVSGWTVEVSRTDDLHYTATYTNTDNSTTFQKTITLQQSGTTLDGAVKTYNGETETKDFTASDTITVKATPTATGEAPANSAMFAASFTGPGAGQMAVFVGDTQVSAPADKGADGAYTMTVSAADVLAAAGGPGTGITLTAKFVGNNNMADAAGTVNVNISAVAKVEKYGSTTYVGALADAFTEGNSGATVTLLSEVDLGSNYIEIRGSSTFTLDLNGQTVKAADYGAFNILGGSLTIQDSGTGGKIESSNITIKVNSGTLSIKSGTVSGYWGVEISGGTVAISGDAVISGGDTGLRVTGAGKATLSGGTFSGTAAITANNYGSVTLKNLLAEGYAYHRNNLPVTKAEGWVDSNTWGEVSLDTKATLTGTVTVKKCNHTGEGVCEYTPNEGAETHAMTCLACGYAGAAESCAYSDDYGHDETNHWQTCTLCGGKKTEAHGWVHQCTSATGIIRRSCDKCEIETVVGTVSITPDFSVTYGKTGSATLVCTAELADGYSLEPADSADNCWVLMALSDGKSWNLGRELEVKLPADLPAGEYWYDAYPRLSYQGNNTIVKRFNVIGKVTVTPAPLTVTGAAAKDRTYDGTNSVQITGVTLDGVLNSDNVSVDLTGLTGTLSGSDAETYTSVTLPRLTLTGGAASNYTLPQSMGAVPASVTISKATLTATGATVASKTYDGNTAASVSSVTFTGLVPGEALALGTDYTATGTFADANAGTGKSVSIAVTLKDSAKANNYNLTNGSVNATGTIAKASQTAPSITGLPTGTITYGDSFTLHTEGGVSWSASGAATVDSSGKVTVTGTGKVTITATKPGDNNHYSAEDQITFTAVPKVLTVTGLTAEDRAYDGTNAVEITDVTLSGVVTGDTVSVNLANLTGTLNGSDVGTYTAVTLPRLTLTGGAASNYTLTQPAGAVPASVTIEKALALTPKTGDLAVANKQEHTYTYGLGALRPDVPEGMSLGSTAVTYELGPVNLGSYYTSGAMIDGQTLTLPIKAVESGSETKIGTITVTIHTQNFEDMTATIDVRSVNKIIPTGGPNLSGNTLTYGQALSAITLSGNMKDGETPVPGKFEWSNPDNRPAVQENYAAAWIFTPDDNKTYAIVTGTALIQVLPAPITGVVIVLDHTAFKYDGQPHRPGITSVTLNGTPLTADVDYTAAIPEGTEAGTYTVTLTGKGNYTGTATAVFIINPVEQKPLDQKDDDGHELRLEVETGLSTVPEALKTNEQFNTPGKIETALRTRVAEVMSNVGEQIAVFDVTLQYKDASGVWRNVDPNHFPAEGVTAVLPYPAGTGATGYTFTVQHLISSGPQAGTMETLPYELTADGLRCKFSSLSPVAIGYQTATKPNPQPNPGGNSGGGSGGGGWSSSTYAVTVEKSEHGKVTSNRTNASNGSTVTLTVTPDSGYVLDALTVTDSRGNEIKLTAQGGGKYTFTMPSRAVTVKASFVPLPDDTQKPCDGGADCPSRGFSDLGSVGTWYHEAVDYVLRNGLMNGYSNGTFGPNDNLSRAQFAQILFNKEGRPVVNYLLQYSDVANGAWYTEAIRWATSQGVVGGYGNGNFGPNDNITREQLAVMLWRYAGSPAATDKELHFNDADKASGYALAALRWAVENGIINGKGGGILDPQGLATRAQTAQMLKNFLSK